jgi:L-malate glycosyltransferase
MKIAHIVLAPRQSGAEILVCELTVRHRQAGVKSHVIALEPAHADFLERIRNQADSGIRWDVPARSLSRLGRLRWLRRAIGDVRPHVIFAHSVIPAFYARLVTTRPVVPVLHSAEADDFALPELERFERLVACRAATVVAVVQAAADAYARRFRGAQVQTIPNGIYTKRYLYSESSRRAARNEFGFGCDAFVVAQVGRVHPVKQQHVFIEAIVRARRVRPSLRPVIAGLIEDRAYAERLRELCVTNGLVPSDVLLGTLDDVAGLLSAADGFVMPSLMEAHSLAMLEALASGIPILASRIAAFEQYSNQPGVRLLPPGDVSEWAAALTEVGDSRQRFQRPLLEIDISDTAARYFELARRVRKP